MKKIVLKVWMMSFAGALCLPASVAAWGQSAESDFTVTADGVLTAYSGAGGDVVIPETVGGITVTQIGMSGYYPFRGNTSLTSVSVPSAVIVIYGGGSGSYRDHGNGGNGGNGSKVYGSFEGCTGLTGLTIGSGVRTIGEKAFYNCDNLTALTIPNTVDSLGEQAFGSCDNLTALTIADGTTALRTNGDDGPFYGTPLAQMYVGRNVTTYCGSRAPFRYMSALTSVTFGSCVTVIPARMFYDCGRLTGVSFSASVDSIGASAFERCDSLRSITLPASIRYIGEQAFACSGLTSINIPSGITIIEDGTFSGCTNLTTISLPAGITDIGSSAFSGCTGLSSLTLPDNVAAIGNKAFYNCSNLTSIALPSGLTSVGGYAFQDCSALTSMVIPNSVITVGKGAFSGCTSLTNVTLGSSTASVGEGLFSKCIALTEVHSLNPTPPTLINRKAYDNFVPVATATLYVPVGAKAAYQVATGWKNFASILEEGAAPDEPVTPDEPADTTHTEIIVYDTTHVDTTIYDTTRVDITVYDTLRKDTTIYTYQYDTIRQDTTIYDTTRITVTDTTLVPDTIVVHDTVIIHDTVVDERIISLSDTVYIVIGATGVQHTVSNETRVSDAGEGIVLSGLTTGDDYAIYSLTGSLVAHGAANPNGNIIIPTLPPGTYILLHAGKWSKFVHLAP